jgi:hypothetical protein
MMNARTVPSPTPFPTSAALIGIMVSARIYMGKPIAAYVPVLVSSMDFIQQIRKRTIIKRIESVVSLSCLESILISYTACHLPS